MEFLPYTIKWLEVILRWGHVLFAILWVGNSFLFNYLDNNLNKNITSDDIDGEGYLMHSGFFYKLSRLKTSPPQDYLNRLVIFKWQSYLTFVTGMLLLVVIYYYNAGVLMVDKRVLLMPPSYAIIISLLSLIVAWFIYDLLCKSKLIENNILFISTGIILLAVVSFGLTKLFGPKFAILSVGLIIGSNIYSTFLVLFIMLSGHSSFLVYHQYNWLILCAIAVISGVARHYFNLRGRNIHRLYILISSIIALIVLAVLVLLFK
jgi:uncharacterized membrane protein